MKHTLFPLLDSPLTPPNSATPLAQTTQCIIGTRNTQYSTCCYLVPSCYMFVCDHTNKKKCGLTALAAAKLSLGSKQSHQTINKRRFYKRSLPQKRAAICVSGYFSSGGILRDPQEHVRLQQNGATEHTPAGRGCQLQPRQAVLTYRSDRKLVPS